MLDWLLLWDAALLAELTSSGSAFWDSVMAWISNRWIWIPFYLLLLFLLFRELPLKSFLWAVGYLILLVIATDQISVHLFKFTFERPRPCHEPWLQHLLHLYEGHCGGPYGFVSSHAANVFGFATFLGMLFKRQWAASLLLIWAALIGYSRIYLGVHYPLDVLGGLFLGVLLGLLAGYLFYRFLGGASASVASSSAPQDKEAQGPKEVPAT
ncbi:MAG: phosphatase PAP2 family protein [Schleiferiaceae bacterium]|nr:phosphatase PAP2 family protein [Schleiferiaceae bacterium]MDR9442394.1 phosphatase PAP2 family protein [Schleiferiaceae bacterium]